MQKNGTKSRKTIVIVVIVAVVAIVLAVASIITISNNRELAQAANDTCNLNVKSLTVHQDSFKEAQEAAEEASKLTADDVADSSTLDALKKAIASAEDIADAPSCPTSGSANDYNKATEEIKDYSDTLRSVTNDLDSATKSVTASQELKQESSK